MIHEEVDHSPITKILHTVGMHLCDASDWAKLNTPKNKDAFIIRALRAKRVMWCID
jgi:hypothetical protein